MYDELPGIELHPGEQVLEVVRRWGLIVLPAYVLTLGLFHFWWRRCYLALTTERLVYSRGIILVKKHRLLPLARIQDATYERRFISGAVELSTAGGGAGVEAAKGLRPAEAKSFVGRVQEVIRKQAGTGLYEEPRHAVRGPAPVPSPAAPAGWYTDPIGTAPLRYWSGNAWTEHTSDGGPQPAAPGTDAGHQSAAPGADPSLSLRAPRPNLPPYV